VRVLAFCRGAGEHRGGVAEAVNAGVDERLRSVIKEGNQGMG
jgi:hypothetical protein